MTTPEFRGDDARAVRRELNYLRTRLDELARANPARSTAIPDGNGVVRARYGIDGFHFYDETGDEISRFDADGAHWYDASGNEVVRIDVSGAHWMDTAGNEVATVDITGLHVLNAAGVEQVAAGNLGSGVYGLEVIRAGVPVNLADYVFGAGFAHVSTGQSTSSTSYTDLATAGPSVTVTVGASGKVWLLGGAYAEAQSDVADQGAVGAFVGFSASGANTISDTLLTELHDVDNTSGYVGELGAGISGGRLLTGLAAGATTFKLRYGMASGVTNAAVFRDRWLFAQPL